jgi:23S rRNA A2030 N6-methylase RlmJ
MSFITKSNILNNAQHVFRKGKSTETATHAFLENIQKAIEKKDKPYWNFFSFIKSL